MRIVTIFILVLLLTNCSQDEPRTEDKAVERTTIESIAVHYGIEHWNDVKRLAYTFVVVSPDSESERRWEWFPQQDSIVFHSDSLIAYKRAELDTSDAAMVAVDKRFINDSYWLLFPFQIYWSEVDTKETAGERAPISGSEATKVEIRFGNKGYTPNDVYDIYINENYQIIEWVFKSGGSEDNPRPITWEGHERFGPILISTLHRSPDGTPRIKFTGIEVDLE